MAQWQVGEETPAVACEIVANTVRVGDNSGGHVPVGENHTLGVTSSSTGVANGNNTVAVNLLLLGGKLWGAVVAWLATPLLQLDLVEQEDANGSSPLSKDIALGRRDGVHRDDNLEGRASGRELEQICEVVGRGEDDGQGAVVGTAHISIRAP